ncbi:hypothetical protein ONE63_011367 [Megalurothrips usitatus]|uniref:Uncharacterized protein n=1 Tax=Megalurothrips usitatus TaxID=439358 RepID=A0AAV7X5W3_9NEOP|nr:hypothetical protein ONE63_011367 [Megalurothrips usitatus]
MTWVPTHDKDRLQRELIAAAAALPLEDGDVARRQDEGVDQDQGNRDREQADLDAEAAAVDDVEAVEVEKSAEDDFFGVSYLQQSHGEAGESAADEVERYLAAPTLPPADAVKRCFAVGPNGKREFPRLARSFLKLNTALPSSAAVERFFFCFATVM